MINESSIFIGNFTTDITFQDYQNEIYDKLHNSILSLPLITDILFQRDDVYMYPMVDGMTWQNNYSESREITYIIFQIFYCPQPLYINGVCSFRLFRDENKIGNGGKMEISDINYIDNYLKEDLMWGVGRDFFLMRYLAQVRYWFKDTGIIELIGERYGDKVSINNYTSFFNDIKDIPNIAEDFANCIINAKMKNGQPYSMEVSTHSKNTNIKYRKDVLGRHRKIEENVAEDEAKSLKVTKKFKYGNNDSKV